MLRNYIKTAWRNLLKNKFYSFINISGLTLGLTIGILILLWVQDELSFNTFHKQTPDIYRMELFGGTGASKQIWQSTVAPMGPLAKQEFPEVTEQVRIANNFFFSVYKYKDKSFSDDVGVFVDPSFFSVFDFKLAKGDAQHPFPDNNSIIITQTTARKYFGNEDALGKIIETKNDKVNFKVSGVINDFPENSDIKADMIMPMSFMRQRLINMKNNVDNDFNQYMYNTYLVLKPGTSVKALSAKLNKLHLKHRAEDTDADYLLLPLAKMHLYNADGTNRGIETVRVFIVISILILIIAAINYVNLSTARSMLRAKEISMRKIIGAAKSHLFMQFMIETALLFVLAATLAIGLIYILMPVFNQVSGKQLIFDLADYHIWLVILLTITGTLITSSIYPALLLSSFQPLKALKGKISNSIGDVLFRKILVVTQFAFSIMLIAGTIVITTQLNYIRTKQLGYDRAHVLTCNMAGMFYHYEAVKAELLKQPGVLAVTRASDNIVKLGNITGNTDWEGKLPGQTFIVRPMAVDKDFISFFKMKMVTGAAFTGSVADTNRFILNEAAIKELGLKNPVGKRFKMGRTDGTIMGVIKDFHFSSMKEKISPAVFYYNPDHLGSIYVKTTGQDAQKAIAATSKQFKAYNSSTFNYSFLDDDFNRLYKGEQQEGILFIYFAGIAIFISCLGLLGLAAYTAQVRTREIGVRKVLGASVANITRMLSLDFLILVLVSVIIATPVVWYGINNWLQGFAYRTTVHWWVFALAGAAAVLIALVTISFQAIKAAMANPVKSLRSE
ncbi:MAG: ABC transporter permease [Bacteroidota bacterium]